MDIRQKAIKSVVWFGGTQTITQIFSWLSTFIIVRLLSPSDFGLYGMALSYFAIIESIYDLNLGSALLQKKDLQDEDLYGCFWLIAILALGFYGLSCYFSGPISAFFHSPQLILIMQIMGLGIVFQSYMIVPYWILTRELDFDKRSKATLYSGLISTVLCLSSAVFGLGVWALVIRFLSQNLFLTGFIYYYSGWRPKFKFNPEKMISFIQYGAYVTGDRLFEILSRKVDIIIIGRMLDKTMLGFYTVAIELSRLPINKVIKIINQISFPVFSKLQGDLGQLTNYFLKISRLIAVFSFPVLVGGSYIAHDLILFVFGSKWQPMIPVFQILCSVALLQTLFGVVSALNKAVNAPKLNFKFTLTLAILIGLSFLITASYGLVTAAFSWVVVYPVVFFIFVYYSIKKINLQLTTYLMSLAPPFSASLAMLAVLTGINYLWHFESGLAGVVTNVLAGAFAYTLTLFACSRDTVRDILQILKDLR